MAVKDLLSSRSSLPCAFSRLCLVATGVLLLSWIGQSQAQFFPPSNGTCACLDQNLTYTCTAEGPGATIWNGSALECPTQEIRGLTLRHTNINDNTAFGECNDGAVIARGVNVQENRFYTSELVANVSSELNGSTINCVLSAEVRTIIGSARIVVISGPYPQVSTVRFTNANANTLTLSWPSEDPTCSSISYELATSGCGTCSIATNMTTAIVTATCTGWQLGDVCNFSVQSVICGFTGMPSNTESLAIKVPDPPRVAVIPVYSADMNNLSRLSITVDQQDINSITNPKYTVSFSGSMQQNFSCTTDLCEDQLNPPFQECDTSTSSISNVSVSASNVFGQGGSSTPQNFGCKNDFVQVNYASSAIVCTFSNAMDTSVKSCTVTYGPCDRELDEQRNANSTVDQPNHIEIQLDTSITNMNCFMYDVTASNGTFTIIVEGTRSTQSGTTLQVVVIATVIPVVVLVAIAVVTVILIMVVCIRRVRSNPPQRPTQAQAQLDEEYFEPHQPHPKYATNPTYLSEFHPDYLEQQDRDKEASETKAL